MKTLLLLPVFLMITHAAEVDAPQARPGTSGLYMSLEDFIIHKLTYQIDCSNPKDKIVLNEFFGGPAGYVLNKGEKHAFNKNRVYGFQSCENKNYRFYNHSIYQILDTAGFYIYYQYRSEEHIKGKGLVKTDEYFFSRKGSDDMQLLSIDNLKKSFHENVRFQYALDNFYRTDKDLIIYDNFQHTYKIKYLYNQSVN